MTTKKLAVVSMMLSAGLLMGARNPSTATPAGNAMVFGNVTICHFSGHQGDFVTFNSASNPAGNPVCDQDGGSAIMVAPQGCRNGHAAGTTGRDNYYSCDDGDLQADGSPQ